MFTRRYLGSCTGLVSASCLVVALATSCQSASPPPATAPARQTVQPSPVTNAGAPAAGEAAPPVSESIDARTVEECPAAATLCKEKDFVEFHRSGAETRGAWVEFGPDRGYLALPPAGAASSPGIVLLHNARGLSRTVEVWADRFAELGYAVIAPDFYQGKVAKDDEEAVQFRTAANKRAKELVGIARQAFDMLATDTRIRSKRRALIGWSYGGAWATYLATEFDDVSAVVTYAGNAVTNESAVQKIEAPVLMVRGENDELFTAAEANQFAEIMTRSGRSVEVLQVPGGHALTDPTRDSYSETDDWTTFIRVRGFLREHLGR